MLDLFNLPEIPNLPPVTLAVAWVLPAIGLGLSAITSLFGAKKSSDASKKAAAAQSAAADRAAIEISKRYDESRALMDPYVKNGGAANDLMGRMMSPGGGGLGAYQSTRWGNTPQTPPMQNTSAPAQSGGQSPDAWMGARSASVSGGPIGSGNRALEPQGRMSEMRAMMGDNSDMANGAAPGGEMPRSWGAPGDVGGAAGAAMRARATPYQRSQGGGAPMPSGGDIPQSWLDNPTDPSGRPYPRNPGTAALGARVQGREYNTPFGVSGGGSGGGAPMPQSWRGAPISGGGAPMQGPGGAPEIDPATGRPIGPQRYQPYQGRMGALSRRA
ncbi:MAG: hypothetical protein NUW22_04815 [Acidobacteria bacterium]|nr:hypothetical protein [Acidobacteriota bacterium]